MSASAKATTTAENYITNITSGNHQYIVDEPLDKGGQDKGVKPTELLAASLASCTAITIKMYVNHKGWEVGDVEVQVNMEHDDKYQNATFERIINIKNANLDESQYKRLSTVANACPIHKLLEGNITVNTKIS